VLRLLRETGGLSRAELARRSGLAKATVGTIVGQLRVAGAVAEDEATPQDQQTVRGRPSTPLVVSGHGLAGLGIEVNVDYVAVTSVDLAGREIAFEERPLDGERPDLEEVFGLARGEVRRLESRGIEVLGLTVAVPGLIDRDRGVVVNAPNLGWSEVPLAEALARDLGDEIPVAVDNDANCAARAERAHGVAVGVDDLVYLTGTVGLGAGIVQGGRVLRGSRGLAGEVGHMRVGEDESCGCGRRGCWEALVGLRALEHATGVPVAAGEDPVAYAARLVETAGTAPAIAAVADALARGVALLSATLDPRMVVLGGSFVPLGALLLPAVEQALAAGFTGPGCTVALSDLGLHAASVGAAIDSLDDVYTGRRSLPA
jgi:predicted NBD/HSP70 family sugar kinase